MASRWLPVLVWAGVIFAFSSVPSLNSGLGTLDLVLRKGAHMTEYAILGMLLVRATGSYAWAFSLTVADDQCTRTGQVAQCIKHPFCARLLDYSYRHRHHGKDKPSQA